MSNCCHLLLQSVPHQGQALRRRMAELDGVVEAALTSGPYDVIVRIDASKEGVLEAVLAAARSAPELWLLALCRPPAVAA